MRRKPDKAVRSAASGPPAGDRATGDEAPILRLLPERTGLWRRLALGVGLAVVTVGFLVGSACAQDRRMVSEPKIPASCVQLFAKLRGTDSKLATADESKLDTARIQAALDGCSPGLAVELRSVDGNNAFLTGPLELRSGVTLLIDEGVTLFGSRDAKVYELVAGPGGAEGTGLCGTIAIAAPTVFPAAPRAAVTRGGCRPLIAATDVHDTAVMGRGIIDGRGYAKILGRDYSWWEMARRAEPENEKYFSMRLIAANDADGFTLYQVTLHNSPNFHVVVNGTRGFTAWGVHILTPTDRRTLSRDNDARNTDGIDPGSSSDITIAHSWIDNGDDNIAIKDGAAHISVLDNHFYRGHGMSIGSGTMGQAFLLVDGLVEDHTSSGIRIKSNVTRGGLIHDLTYRNICMREVATPIAISPYYTNQTTEPFEDPKYTGDKIPDYKSIRLENIHAVTPGNVLIAGLDGGHITEVLLNDVTVEGITAGQVHMNFVNVELGVGGANFTPAGGHVVVHRLGGDYARASARRCSGKFIPMR